MPRRRELHKPFDEQELIPGDFSETLDLWGIDMYFSQAWRDHELGRTYAPSDGISLGRLNAVRLNASPSPGDADTPPFT